ncbi:PREDICTED: pentatricopeptide repeat-containing protein At2g40720 [Camelina sativa]|uniref:Pentatricopeptide repeat-containing protein At2g40720 n=1 Tax=Camelina sativa TaxID=90675 RepID=A0ABM0YXX4_CAMSA|nr:PREDICTED: pentatricopeptide repeat-containing protein At2g40720 [Camelina sativa]
MRFKLHDVQVRRGLSCLADSHVSPAWVGSGIRALTQRGEYLQALHLYTKHDGSSPLWTSVFTFPSLLKACSFLTNLSYGKTIHASVTVLGWRYNPFIATSLVNMYVKCGSLDYAVQVFDGWSHSGVYTSDVTVWNSMIDGYFKFRRFKEGVECFSRMLVLGVRPDAFSLSTVVSVLCKEGNFRREEGKQIHGYMLRNSLDGDSFLKTALIDMYFKFGLPTDAWRVFVEVEDKSNVVLWNVMIAGFGSSGICESSLELYILAKSNSVKLVSTSFTGALGACSRSENSGFGRQIHCDVVKMGFDNDPYVSTSLLSMYSKCGMIGEGETVFSCVIDQRLEIWNAMIAAYVENEYGYSALELYGFMRQKSVLPDSFTLSNVISCCSMLGLYDYGKSVHTELFKRPIQSTPTIESALLTLYSKCGCDNDAYLVFKSMEGKDLVAWGSLISGLCKNGKFKEALEVFGSMKDEDDNLKPDSDVMTSVINACAGLEALRCGLQYHGGMIKTGLVLNVFVGSSLIDLYSKCGLPEMALKVFTSMRPDNIVAWNSMISCYSRNNLPELSIELFNLMLNQGVLPDSLSVTSVLVAISSTASLLSGKSLHGYTLRRNITSDSHLKNALIDMYIKCGFSKYAENIFKKMLHKSVITWNLMIYGYGSHGDCFRALSLFDEMKKAGESPNDVTFLSLISACNHSGLVQEGKNIFEIMKHDYGIEPNIEHYANMVDLLGRAGHLEEAYSFIKGIPIEPDSSMWQCLLSASRTHHNVELGILSAEKLLRMEPERGSTYVQLINLYMEAGLKDEAAKLLGEMKEKGLQKKPGCSSIDVSNRTYVFFSGGSSSPIQAEVFNVLNWLKSNMLDENKST